MRDTVMLSSRPLKLLIVEDSPHDAELEEYELRRGGLDLSVHRVETRPELETELKAWHPDLVISDFSLPGLNGLDVLDITRRFLPAVPFIFVSGTIGEERAIEAMKRGATDYVVKDRLSGLVVRVKRALDEAGERDRLRRLEQELRQSQKMDSLGRLAGAVAHDFNNMLTAILSYGQLALGKMGSDAPARPDLEQLCRAGESAVGLTRQLLAFSRKSPFTIRPVDLNAVIETMQPLLSRLLGPGIEIIARLDPGAGAVLADVGGLKQILLNLAMNSRDAMPSGGRLSFTTSRVAPGRSTPSRSNSGVEEHVTLLVSDNGTGIDPEVLPRIFEPFFTTKDPGRGTGLGLSTVYGLVQTFQGSISVVSEIGKGSTFWIHLPASRKPADGAAAAVDRPVLPRGSETILVAEDSTAVRALVVRVLAAQGYRVLEAADGEQALALASSEPGPIALLLTDFLMPRLNGRDLARKLRERRPEMKVVLMSGMAEEDGPEPGWSMLEKPFTPLKLSQAVRAVLDAPAADPA